MTADEYAQDQSERQEAIKSKKNSDAPLGWAPLGWDEKLKPASYEVRLYVLRGLHLTALDEDTNTSDAYLRVKLGNQIVSGVDHPIVTRNGT